MHRVFPAFITYALTIALFVISALSAFSQTFPPDQIEKVACYEEAVEPVPPVVIDDCGDPMDVELVLIEESPDPAICGGVKTFTFHYTTDCNDAEGYWSMIYLIEADTEWPVVISMPPDITIYRDENCEYDAHPDSLAFGYPLIEDNCDPEPELYLTYLDNVIQDDVCMKIIARVWTISDRCGNVRPVPAGNIIIVKDKMPPSLIEGAEIPEGETGLNLCFVDIPEGPTEDEIAALFEDNCGDVIVTKSGAFFGNDCGWEVTYTYTIEDECGNEAQPIEIFYSGGNEIPPLVSCPPTQYRVFPQGTNQYIVDGNEFDFLEAIDNCGNFPMVSNNLNEASTLDGFVFEADTTEVIWTAVDACGLFTECSFEVIIFAPDILLEKTGVWVDHNGDGWHSAGDKISYEFTITNIGDVPLNDVHVADANPDVYIGDSYIGMLDIDEVAIRTGVYTVTQADIDQGSFTNYATATGTFDLIPEFRYYTSTDSHTEIFVQHPSVELIKSADADSIPPGFELGYHLILQNTGNITLTDIIITDTLPAYTNFVWVSGNGVYEPQSRTLQWTYLQLDVGEIVEMSFVVMVNQQVPHDWLITNYATVVASELEEVSSNITETSIIPPPVLELVSITHVACYGEENGSATVQVTGGVPEIIITWFTDPIQTGETATGLAAGAYTVVAEDSMGLTDTLLVTIEQPPGPLNANAIVSDVLCYGESTGAITLEVFDGTPPYQFEWSNGASTQNLTGIPVGYYHVLITDANGCTFELDAYVEQPDEMYIYNIEIVGVDCKFDPFGSIYYEVDGGVPPYSFLWNTGETVQHLYDIIGGEYEVVITDQNGCELVETFFVDYQDDICEILVPGGLTPDGDGINDVLYIDGLHRHPLNSLSIYNRHGTMVFQESPYQNEWDGVPNRGRVVTEADGRLPSGTYFYVLVLEPGEDPLTGYIYLIR